MGRSGGLGPPYPTIVSSSTKSSGGCPQYGQVRGDSHWPANSSSIPTPANRATPTSYSQNVELVSDPVAIPRPHAP